jgi:YceI-like protein
MFSRRRRAAGSRSRRRRSSRSASDNRSIKGITREVEVKATVEGAGVDPWGNERVGVAVRGTIDRTELGLGWQQRLPTGGLLVGEEVQILLNISAVRSQG